ncbi:glycosyltransferase [Salinicola salarius]|uniref:glycosyltransferase n=1 Tax=Salinicola salarius TaxID=430457 RepID=UPI000B403E6A|nr:glycosyltransferase [Salinicola salarius]
MAPLSIVGLLVKLVSLLIRTYQRPALLREALRSIALQHYRPIEVIVVNDDATSVRDVVSETLEATDIHWQYADLEGAKGRSAAANRALEMAQGDMILFLDDDDWIAPEHVQQLVARLTELPDHIGVYADTVCVHRDTPEKVERYYCNEYDSLRLATENYLPIHAVLFRRAAIDAGCRFDPELSVYEDWHFWLQVTRLGPLQRLATITAYYSLDVSGVGGKSDRDFTADRLLALRKALPLLTDAQVMHLGFLSQALREAQVRVDAMAREHDERQRQMQQRVERQQQTLDHLQIEKLALERQVTTHLFNRQAIHHWSHTITRKSRTLLSLLKQGDWAGIKERVNRHWGQRADMATVHGPTANASMTHASRTHASKNNASKNNASAAITLEAGVDILCTHHTRYVAYLIAESLERLGSGPVTILAPDSRSFSDRLHIVVCPQMFETLPGCYIAFQMEQSVSSRWFDTAYFQRLENALAVLDYSLKNIEYLQTEGNLEYRQLFHVPISNLSKPLSPSAEAPVPEYDVVFYGDIHNPRRKAFLDAIGQRYKLLVVNEVFGEALYAQLRRARLVLNIHYYEGALLETTRIYECLSLGLPVVSERSVDMVEHADLEPWVSFTDIGEVDQMLVAIDEQLALLDSGHSPLADLPEDLAHFHFHFARTLAALDLVSPDVLDTLPPPLDGSALAHGVGLSLPETFARHQAFKATFPDFAIFPGLRHAHGWRGAALSFRYLARRALEAGLTELEVREDDVLLEGEAQQSWQRAKRLFRAGQATGRFDLLCGLIADTADATRVIEVFEEDGRRYVVIDRMTSMVCNVYGERAMKVLAAWDPQDRDIERNTIDRYLERHTLRVLVPLPFIAGHQPEQTSTLWNFTNSTYDVMIEKSQAVLAAKADDFVRDSATTG